MFHQSHTKQKDWFHRLDRTAHSYRSIFDYIEGSVSFHTSNSKICPNSSLSSNRTRAKFVVNKCIEFFGLLFLRHHAATVEDFKTNARIETEQFGGVLKRVGLVLLAPNECDGMMQACEGRARVGVEIAGEKGCDGVLRARLMAGGVVLCDEAWSRATPIIKEF